MKRKVKCLVCNIGFETNHPLKKYCSRKCYIKFCNLNYGNKSKKKYRESKHGKKKEKEFMREYYKKNQKFLREKRKENYYKNSKKERKKRMEYYYNNLDKELSEENKLKRKECKRRYSKLPENKKKIASYERERKRVDEEYRIRCNLRTRFNHALNYYKKFGVILKSKRGLINYKAIIEHLKPFPEDISKYHIDHIKPLVSFKLVNDNGSPNELEIKKAFVPENHQWLTIEENLKKWKN